ncbi:MAG: isocitrate lyase/phosphoenolpyruvate mutase family protein [Betaproteobacteria bacterium]|nr:isocitrate lyase/phosphoenolpyruvate mutase family protein [Betaproteobacteria bacterium]
MAKNSKAEQFRALHAGPRLLVLPNAWDFASALLLERAGFNALATTSAGIGYTFGYPIGQAMPRQEMLSVIHRMAERLSVPLSADMEAGYGDSPQQVAETTRLTAEAGAVGINIEDRTYRQDQPLIEIQEAADRVRAACEAARPFGMFVNARTDVYWLGGTGEAAFAHTVQRANTFREAGADCLFVPGVKDPQVIRRLVAEIDGPLNILAGLGSPNTAELEAMGVRRVTFGATMARAAYAALEQAAAELATAGTYGFMSSGSAHADMNRLLRRHPDPKS